MGRVGRAFLRLAAQSSDLEVVAVNDLVDVRALERLIRRDSTFGRFPVDVKMCGDDVLLVGDNEVSVSDCQEPKLIALGRARRGHRDRGHGPLQELARRCAGPPRRRGVREW